MAFVLRGITRVLATHLVGSLERSITVGSIVIPDQFIDFARDRPRTLFDSYGHKFVDMTNPYCPVVRAAAMKALEGAGLPARGGCYLGVDGPRLETAAEVRLFASWGGSVVGMTGTTEARLFREAGICYGSLALVSNMGAGLISENVCVDDMLCEAARYQAALGRVTQATLEGLLGMAVNEGGCCGRAPSPTIPRWRQRFLDLTGEQSASIGFKMD
jgi:5'-methylthioadenosine phosphorylase